MIKCEYCTSEQKGDLPDGLLYTKNLKDFSPLFGESAMDIRFDEYDVCYALWSDHCETVEKKRLDFKYCPMCGRKLKPAHGRYPYKPKKESEVFVFETRVEAEHFWDNLREQLEEYSIVTMADAYRLIGVIPDKADFNCGWAVLSKKAPIKGTYSDGWSIEFPPFSWVPKEDVLK